MINKNMHTLTHIGSFMCVSLLTLRRSNSYDSCANDESAQFTTIYSSTGNKKYYDVLIVGGGIVGTSLAYEISKHNVNLPNGKPKISIALLEKDTCGSEASGMRADTIWCAGHAPHIIEPIAETCALSMDVYREVQESGHDCGLVESGNLILACNKKEAQHIHREYAFLERRGYVSEFLSNYSEIISKEPELSGTKAIAALYTPLSGYVEPMLATKAIASIATQNGVNIIENSNVDDIIINVQSNNAVRGLLPPVTDTSYSSSLREQSLKEDLSNISRYAVKLSNGQIYHCNHLVIAAGNNCEKLLKPLGIRIPIFPVAGVMFETHAINDMSSNISKVPLKKTIYIAESDLYWSEKYALSKATKVNATDKYVCFVPPYCTHDSYSSAHPNVRYTYGRPRGDGSIVFGGCRIPLPYTDNNNNMNYSIDLSHVEAVYDHVKEIFPHISLAGRSGGQWTGAMPFSGDGRPFVGSLRLLGNKFSGLWISGGFGPDGIMLGPGAGKILANAILDELSISQCSNFVTRKINETNYTDAVSKSVLSYLEPCRSGGASYISTN